MSDVDDGLATHRAVVDSLPPGIRAEFEWCARHRHGHRFEQLVDVDEVRSFAGESWTFELRRCACGQHTTVRTP